jgi:simple sugar transport system ATP-binding protein
VMFKGRVVGEFQSGWEDNDLIAAIEGLDQMEGTSHE